MIETHCLRTDGQITVIMTCRAAFTATNIVNSGQRVAYEGLSQVASLFFREPNNDAMMID